MANRKLKASNNSGPADGRTALQQLVNASAWSELPVDQQGFFEHLGGQQAGGGFTVRLDGSTIQMSGSVEGIRISSIFTPVSLRNQDRATRLMELVCECADAYKLPLLLKVDPLDEEGLDRRKLVKWYRGFGFTGHPDAMVRKPGAKHRPTPKKSNGSKLKLADSAADKATGKKATARRTAK